MKNLLWLIPILWCSAAFAQTANCPSTTGSPYTIGTTWTCLQYHSVNPDTLTGSVAYNSNVTAGNPLIAECFIYLNNTAALTSITISDTLTNTWLPAGPFECYTNITCDQIFYVASNKTTGANTVSWAANGTSLSIGPSAGCGILEIHTTQSGAFALDNHQGAGNGYTGGSPPVTVTLASPLVTTQADELVIVGVDTNNGTVTVVSPLSQLDAEAIEGGVEATSGSYSLTFKDSATADQYVFIAASFTVGSVSNGAGWGGKAGIGGKAGVGGTD
jgi:hypothetical protein